MASTEQEVRRMFDYQTLPIDPGKNQIRLLEVYPGKPDDDLAGRLHLVSLDDMPQYDALSYCWGNRSDALFYMTLGDFVVGVRHNLHNALRAIRRPSTTIILWTDAICIDQSNSKELGHQVEQMRRIYASAQVVRAWIDHEVNLNSEIFQQLPNIEVNEIEALRADESQFWSPAVDLLKNAYWRRLWVQQELILAQEVVIHCRTIILDPKLVQWLVDTPRKLGAINSKVGHRGLNNLTNLVLSGERSPFFLGFNKSSAIIARKNPVSNPLSRLQYLTSEFEQGCLLSLFMQSHHLQTSEDKDRVYGLLGIATDYDVGDITVDYKLSVTRVYSKIAELYIHKYQSLIFLCYYTLGDTEGGEHPTWLPDPQKTTRMLWTFIEAWTLSRVPNPADSAYIHSDGFALSVRGVCVDRISWVQSEVDVATIPISQWMRELGIDHSSGSIDDEQVLCLLFPRLADNRYTQYILPRPDKALQQSAVKRLFDFVNSTAATFSLDDIFYGNVDLSDIASVQELAAFRSIRRTFLLEKIFKTLQGYIGLIDYKSRVQNQDEIWALDGCPLPLILRPSSTRSGAYTRVGCIENMPALMEKANSTGLTENAKLDLGEQTRLLQQIDIW